MEFIPDLEVNKNFLEYPTKRFGLHTILKVPSEAFFDNFKRGIYGWEGNAKDELDKISRKDIFLMICEKTRITNIATGVKGADNIQIRRQWEKNKYYGGMVAPIYDWTTSEVIKYLCLNKIDIPKDSMAGFRGVDLGDDSLDYLAKNYPKDLEKIEAYFPFCKAPLERNKYYDLKIKRHFV